MGSGCNWIWRLLVTTLSKQIQSCAFNMLKRLGSRGGGYVGYLLFGEDEAFVSSTSERLGKILYRNTCWRVTRTIWRGGYPKTSWPWGSEMWSRKSVCQRVVYWFKNRRLHIASLGRCEPLVKVSLRWRVNGILRGEGVWRRTMHAWMMDRCRGFQ